MRKIREKQQISNIVWLFTFIFSFWGIIWSLADSGISTFHFFTLQSNLLVLMTSVIFFIGFQEKKWFKFLAAISLMNIMMTGVIFRLLLSEYASGFYSHILHTITPILYVIFYFVSITNVPKTKQFYVMLIYPFSYFLFFLITGIFTNYYPYGFMNVNDLGVMPVIRLTVFIITPIITLLSIVLLYFKNLLELKIKG